MKPAVFTVETLEAGSGEVLVFVEDPEGHKEEASHKMLSKGLSIVNILLDNTLLPDLKNITSYLPVNPLLLGFVCLQAKVKPNNDKKRTYTVTYVPKVEGVHKVRTNSDYYLVQKGKTALFEGALNMSFLSLFVGESVVCRSGHWQEPLHCECGEGYGWPEQSPRQGTRSGAYRQCG